MSTVTWAHIAALLGVEALLFAAVCWLVNHDIHVRRTLAGAVAHGAVTCAATVCALLYLGGIR
ncbi:hypothetical protein JJV70_15300 [Streptomyces sp. JJ66]|uniref:hypothetical protein n=1 Tax=Streptomyces sp. JJ66 TaxID=2803843 RepID=UPI001C599611|nr:hypothetical protein [Streptomyces sp. JJ66]MBW1603446.1 hypothetical protein [Streptomyces sp. JJ66]